MLTDKKGENYPDLVAVIADATNLRIVYCCFYPADGPGASGYSCTEHDGPVAKSGLGLDIKLASQLDAGSHDQHKTRTWCWRTSKNNLRWGPSPDKKYSKSESGVVAALDEIRKHFGLATEYEAFHTLRQTGQPSFLNGRSHVPQEAAIRHQFFSSQGAETFTGMDLFNRCWMQSSSNQPARTGKVCPTESICVLTHRVWGIPYFTVLVPIFQSVFALAQIPMDAIDRGFAGLSTYPESVARKVFVWNFEQSGIVPGIGGIIIFIPQIAILFAFIAILVRTGYMSRCFF